MANPNRLPMRLATCVALLAIAGATGRAAAQLAEPFEPDPAATRALAELVEAYRKRPALTVKSTLRIELSQGKSLMVPLNSLVTSDGYHYVFIVNPDMTVTRQMIETGTIQGDNIEVRTGLDAGANIVTSGAGFLKNGDRVNVVGDF